MGQLTERLKKDFIKNGFEKKEATKKAHEYWEKYNLCRSCSESIKPGEQAWLKGYCVGCCQPATIMTMAPNGAMCYYTFINRKDIYENKRNTSPGN